MAKNGEYDDDIKDPSLAQAASDHENAVMDSDQISAWQCMAQNPKIVLWTVFANSKSCVRCHHGQRIRARLTWNTSRHGACGLREPRFVCLSRDARVPVSEPLWMEGILGPQAPDPSNRMTFASEVDGHLIIPAYWQSAWNAMYNVMIIFGSVVAGYVQDRLSRRAVLLLAAIVATGGIAAAFVANTPAQFLGSKIVTGTAVGLFLTATQTYVSEIAPLPMRGIALSVNTTMLVRVAQPKMSLLSP